MAIEMAGKSFFHKMLFAILILALLIALLPAAAVSAAPASGGTPVSKNLKNEWRDKIQNVKVESLWYQRVRAYPADYEDLNELALAHEYLNNYGAALRSAQSLIFSHTGFDTEGEVMNENLANQTVKAVAENLRIMRAMKAKLNGLEGKYRLLPASAVTTTAQ
jgi:hypothetical protein